MVETVPAPPLSAHCLHSAIGLKVAVEEDLLKITALGESNAVIARTNSSTGSSTLG